MIKINKYEKAIMFNTKLMKLFYAVIFISNLAIPLKLTDSGVAFSISVFNIIALGVLLYALLNGLGYFRQNIPFLWIGAIRICQGIYKFIISPDKFNWYGFAVLVVLDFLFICFLFMDRRNYSYVEEEDTDDN